MRNGVFDPTLNKYQSGHSKPKETLDHFNIGHHYKKWLDSTGQTEPTAHVIYTQNMINKWGSINFPDLADCLLSQGLAPKTFNDRKNVLKRFVKWLVKKKIVSENPLEDVASQRVKIKRPQRIAFRDAEITKILGAFANNTFGTKNYPHKHYEDFIRFLFMTGCRNAEAIGLTVGKVNFAKSEIVIDESLARQANQTHSKARVRKGTKMNNSRYIPMTFEMEMMLIPRCLHRGKDELVFTSFHGKSIDDRMLQRRVFKPILRALNIPERDLTAIRATWASKALEQGFTPLEAGYIMGHNNAATIVSKYAQVREAPKNMPEIIKKAPLKEQPVKETATRPSFVEGNNDLAIKSQPLKR